MHAAVTTGQALGEHPLTVLTRWIRLGAGLALAEGLAMHRAASSNSPIPTACP